MKRTRKVVKMLALTAVLAGAGHVAVAQINPFGALGASFTKEDSAMLNAAVSKVLENENVGFVRTWNNPKSGNRGTIEYARNLTRKNLPCKQIRHVVNIKRETDQRVFQTVWCRVGSDWKRSD